MKNGITTFLAMLYFYNVAVAQKPTEVPKPSEEPIDLTNPSDIIIYIVLPLCILLFFFIWRKKKRK